MIGNTLAYKRMLKKEKMLEQLEQAKKDNIDWKVRQLEGKIACFNSKFYPTIFWDSSKGTYRKPKTRGA